MRHPDLQCGLQERGPDRGRGDPKLVLPKMAATAEEIYATAKERRSRGRPSAPPPAPKAPKLRERDPW